MSRRPGKRLPRQKAGQGDVLLAATISDPAAAPKQSGRQAQPRSNVAKMKRTSSTTAAIETGLQMRPGISGSAHPKTLQKHTK